MRGFILLEVLVSIMISSMIFMTLMGAIFQLSKARIVADDTIDVYTRVSTIMSLIEQDFGGATIPVQVELPNNESQKVQPEPQKKVAQESEQKETLSQEQGAGKQEKTKPIKHIFYSTAKDRNNDLITCITNNPTTIYWSETAGKAKSRIARVIYTLVPDKEHKESFLLKRQEGSELDFAAYTNPEKPAARSYEIAEGIKGFSITYLYIEKKEEPQNGTNSLDTKNKPKDITSTKEPSSKQSPPQKPDYKAQNQWGTEEKESGDTKSKQPLMPHYMVVHLTLWSSTYKKDHNFEFVIELCASEAQQIKQAKMRYEKEKSPSESPTQKPALNTASQPTTKTVPEIPQNNSSSMPNLDLMAYSKPPLRNDTQETISKKEDQIKEPIIVASDNHMPKNFEEKLAENIMHGIMQEIEDQRAKALEEGEPQEDLIQKNNIDSVEQPEQELIDMPAGRIDVIQDGDKAYVVYQGPIPITQKMIEEALS